MRYVEKERRTSETQIKMHLNIDGTGQCDVQTGIGFLDHMLELFAFHGQLDLEIEATGDLYVDGHHLIEDIGLLMGACLKETLGDKKGIERYGTCLLPMDETLARVVLDLSGRPALIYDCLFDRFDLGTLETENIKEFLKSLVNESKMTLHVSVLYGDNDHHKAEAIFKGFGRALNDATRISHECLQSTKGVL